MTVNRYRESHDIVVLRTIRTVYDGRVVVFKCVKLVHHVSGIILAYLAQLFLYNLLT